MTRYLLHLLLLIALFASMASPTRGGAVICGDGNDAYVDQANVNDGYYDHLYSYVVGTLFSTTTSSMVEPFQLPYLAPGQQVTGASISFYYMQKNSSPNYNIQLYGLNRVTATSLPAALLTDNYAGTNDTANTLLDATFITPSTTANQAVTYSGANLAAFVQKQYTNAAFSGMDLSNSRYIYFRLSPDAGSQGGFNCYQLYNSRNPQRSYHPMLSLTISNGISNIAGRLQFSFNLPQAAITSAGVYNASTGALIRTLWNNVGYQQGTNYGVWDGNDDSGNAVATGTNYQIKMIYHNVQYIFEGIVGNTSTAQSGLNVYHSFGKMVDMAVGGNTVYYTVGYDENQEPFGTFPVGSPQVPTPLDFNQSFTDSSSAISLVTSDATRTYWAKTQGGYGGTDTYVVASVNGADAFYTFPKGTSPGSGQKYSSCLDFDSTANQPNSANGLAVQKSGSYIFVSHGNLNVVRVFDKVQGNLVGTFTVTSPGRIATTANGDVWVISNTTPPVVQRYTYANGAATLDRTLTGLSAPAGLGVSADDTLLLVADGGASQQIKAYTNSNGAPAWTYGTLGGMPAAGPALTPNAFCFNTQWANSNTFTSQAFVAFQADNTFWIADGGNGRALHFSINGSTLSYIEQIAYVDVSYNATADLTDATRVYNGFLEYSVNYSLPLAGTNGSWTAVRNWVYGLPNDSGHLYYGYGNGLTNVVTLSNGIAYGFMTNYVTGNQDLFELPPTGPARPTGYSFNNNPRMYEDGSLRFNVIGSSNISFYSQPLTGFDAKSNPVWGSPALLASSTVSGTNPQTWSAYPERTEMTATGTVIDYDPNEANAGYHLGGIAKGGTSWQWQSSPSVNGWTWFPQDGRFDTGDGVQYAGNYHMALGRNIVCGYHGEMWKGGEASQWMNFYDNGLLVGLFGTYGTAGSTQTSVNGFAGNSIAPTLVHAPNGNVYLYHNDESNHGGTCRWRISGWDGITEMSATGAIGGTASLSASTAGPVVMITSPTAGATYLNGNSILLSAQATSSGASIASVKFLDGSTSLGTVTVAPFNLNYTGLATGSHSFTAVATDSNGASTTSAAVTVTVEADGASTAPPAPISLSAGTAGSASVPLTWTQPGASTTSTTIGQILSFQCDSTGDVNALASSTVAGAPSYAVSHFNLLGQSSVTSYVANFSNSVGSTIPNVGIGYQTSTAQMGNSAANLPGTAKQLLSQGVTTQFNTLTAVSISNVPYANYDLVVYSLPAGVNSGAQTTSVTVNDNLNTTTVTQNFTSLQSNYTIATVAFGSSSTVTNMNTVVIQGLTSPSFKLQGNYIAAFQIVEKPYSQGVPTSYNIQRAGTNGVFTTIGTASGGALSYTDTTVSGGASYEYQVQAVNSFGSSAFSNVVSATTPTSVTSSPTPPSVPTAPTAPGFTSWQSSYFTSAQLSDATVSGPTADPYGSGVPNLLAYALQLNPSTANISQVPTAVISNGHLQIVYFVPTAITDINYIIEVSSDLQTWNTGTGYTHVVSTVPSANGTTFTVQDTLPTTTPKHFMRLRVTQVTQ